MTPKRTHLWLLLLLGCGISVLLEEAAYDALARPEWLASHVFHLARLAGFLPLYLLLFFALRRAAPGTAPWWRDPRSLLLWAPLLAFVDVEVLKFLIRRERPGIEFEPLAFRAFSDGLFHTSRFGFPSTHTATAVAGAAVLCRLYPGARWFWITWAAACGLSRIVARAHFATDVYAGMLVGLVCTAFLSRSPPDPGAGARGEVDS